MKITHLLTTALFASSAALAAQNVQDIQDIDDRLIKPYLSLGITLAQGHAHDMAQTTWAGLNSFVAEAGLYFNLPQTTMKARPNIGFAKIYSKGPNEEHPTVYNLQAIYVGVDFIYPPFKSLPITFSTGPSFHVWNVDREDVPPAPGQAMPYPPQGDTGMKLGWRVGATYKINEKFSVTLDYALTEWRKNRLSTTIIPGVNPSRPGYFTIKGSYHF